jgi:hypothetical protein
MRKLTISKSAMNTGLVLIENIACKYEKIIFTLC